MGYQLYRKKSKGFIEPKPLATVTTTISSGGYVAQLRLNEQMCRELGINSLVKHVKLRFDTNSKKIKLSFHAKEDTFTIKLRSNPRNSTVSVNVSEIVGEMFPAFSGAKTRHLPFERDGRYLVVDFNGLNVDGRVRSKV